MNGMVIAVLTSVVLFLISTTTVGALTVNMTFNTEPCIYNRTTKMDDCRTDYLICDDKEPEDSKVEFLFRDEKTPLLEAKTTWPRLTKQRNWTPTTVVSKKSCKTVSISGQKDPYINLDNVLCYDGVCFPEWAWWNHSWDSEFAMNITNNNATAIMVTGYTVTFSFDHAGNVSSGLSTAKGSDVRIVYENSSGMFSLDRINESPWNTSTTNVSFMLQGNITGGSYNDSYKLVMNGDYVDEPPENESRIYWFFEDFDDLTNGTVIHGQNGWVCIGTPDADEWGVTDQGCYSGQCAYIAGEQDAGEGNFNHSLRAMTDFDVSFRLKGAENGGDRFMTLGYLFEGTTSITTSLNRRHDGTPYWWALDGSTDVGDPADDTWYLFNLQVPHGASRGYYDIGDGTATGTQDTQSGMSTGVDAIQFRNEGNAKEQKETWVDTIIVRRFVTPAPTVLLGARQTQSNDSVVLVITDPTNGDSFLTPQSVNVTWRLDAGTCNASWYNLNGAANVSTGCSNFTIESGNFTFGDNHVIAVYANNSNNTIGSDTVTIGYHYISYNVSVMDEMVPGEYFNGTDMEMTIYCANETINYTLNASFQEGVGTDCVITEVRLSVTEAGTTTWRTLIPEAGDRELVFYMANSSAYDVNGLTLYIKDLTNQWTPGIIHVEKTVGNLSDQAILDQNIDAEGKIIFYWVVGERYRLYIESGDETDYIGELIADTSTSKTITVSEVALVPTRTTNGLGWLFGGDINELNLTFTDTRSITVIVAYYVYNASNVSLPLLYNDTCTDATCIFNYTTPNNSSEYRACFEALTNRGYTYTGCEVYSLRTWTIAFFETDPIFYAIVASLVALLIIAGSSAVHIKFGLIGSSIWMIFVNSRGWFSALTLDAATLYVIFGFTLSVSIVYAILEGEKPT